ncbi:MAG TPA: peptidase dimerization domain-containing protein [Ramlibacter sp.]|nr:peptidase dimerization domain-containing protein [Ramlibacter sp.]
MSGPETTGAVQARFRFTGRAAHAAASPHLGRSALDAVELMNVGVNFLRQHLPPGVRIQVAVTDTGGSAPNVVQQNAAVLYTVRSPAVEHVMPVFERVRSVAQGAALMTETELAIDIAPT